VHIALVSGLNQADNGAFTSQLSCPPQTWRMSMAKQTNSALAKPVEVDDVLEAVIGKGPMPRTEVTKKVWDYIKSNDLQDPEDRRSINADDKLKEVLGKDKVTMFELTKLVSQHLK
jgi:chromatin remodeling complex protein RSC6